MITKIERQNINVIVADQEHPKHKVIIDIATKYEKGGDIEALTANWSGGGTSGEAIAEYILVNHKQTKPSTKRKRASKDVE